MFAIDPCIEEFQVDGIIFYWLNAFGTNRNAHESHTHTRELKWLCNPFTKNVTTVYYEKDLTAFGNIINFRQVNELSDVYLYCHRCTWLYKCLRYRRFWIACDGFEALAKIHFDQTNHPTNFQQYVETFDLLFLFMVVLSWKCHILCVAHNQPNAWCTLVE